MCVCVWRMENRDHANEEEETWIVLDELTEDASDPPSAPVGIGIIQFYPISSNSIKYR